MADTQKTIEEITKIYKSLPPRPSIDEVQAALSIFNTVTTEEQLKLQEISMQKPPHEDDLPTELFSILKQFRTNLVLFECYEQKKEALHVIEIDKFFQKFDGLIQSAATVVSGGTQNEKLGDFGDPVEESVKDEGINSDSKEGLVRGLSDKVQVFPGGDRDEEKMSLMKVASVIENCAKTGTLLLNLQGKLKDRVEWLPISLVKLSNLAELNISENQILALPSNIGKLEALKKLDMHSNQLINLPESTGELLNLTHLDLHGNKLKSLPASFGDLTSLLNLNLSSNIFTQLPNIIGKLSSLQKFSVDLNDLEELPYTIGFCTSLVELRLDFNCLKALPEGIGNLENLEILTLHYNRVKNLPTTMSGLRSLKELDVSFNELESIPESLCFVMSLEKLNVGNNFADLKSLPRSIGNLEMLEELDISNNQIRVLPDSFRFLSRLRVLRVDETPLEVPQRHITKLGAQAVVQYMSDLVEKRDASLKPLKKRKGFWFWVLSVFCLPISTSK